MLRLAFDQDDMVFRGQRLARPICGNDTADSSACYQNGLPTMVLPPIALVAALGRIGGSLRMNRFSGSASFMLSSRWCGLPPAGWFRSIASSRGAEH